MVRKMQAHAPFGSVVAAQQRQIDRLEALVERQGAIIQRLEQAVDRGRDLDDATVDQSQDPDWNIPRGEVASSGRPVDRRHLISGAAHAAAGAAVGIVLLGDAEPAGAVGAGEFQGNPAVLGRSMPSDGGTGVSGCTGPYTANPGRSGVFGYDSTQSGGASYGVQGLTEHAASSSAGVYGRATAASAQVYGVVGRTDTTYPAAGVLGTASAATGATNGVEGTSSSSSGTGVRGTTTNGSSNTVGVRGFAAGAGVGVWGANESSGIGVRGSSIQGFGMYGSSNGFPGVYGTSEVSYGVWGHSTSSAGVMGESVSGLGAGGYSKSGVGLGGGSEGSGLGAVGLFAKSEKGVGATVASSRAQLLLDTDTFAPPTPPLNAGLDRHKGELTFDGNGDLWLCVVGGTPGTWRKLAGPKSGGSFHPLAAPVRVYDSRSGTQPSVGTKTPLAAGVARTVDLRANGSGVPAGATAVTVNLLIVGATAGNGNATVWADGAPVPAGNSLVWGGTSGRASTLAITAVDAAGRCQVRSSVKTDVVVDVVGYYQ